MMHRSGLPRTLSILLLPLLMMACQREAPVGAATAATRPPTDARRPFQGRLTLSVDATDTHHQIFTVRETLPVQAPGPLVLLYPQWETGSHAPTASVAELAGLIIHADGRPLAWHRDPVRTHAFHIEVAPGSREITVDLDFLAPRAAALLRPDMVVVPWHRLLLYPEGHDLADIPVEARLRLPAGLQVLTALEVAGTRGDTQIFATTALSTLVDAPVYAGRHVRTVALGGAAGAPVRLDVLADRSGAPVLPPGEEMRLRDMLIETRQVFGAAPFRHYDMILTLSDVLSPGGGIEHGEEGESNLPADYLADLPHQLMNRDLVVHEYVHAWNGRLRQPADLAAPTLNEPVGGSLLWVYEGQTEFWGRVLAARAGLRSVPETLDRLALDAAVVAGRRGRAWKSLADSNNDPLYMAGHPVSWRDWQRREDYYAEGVLLWLDVEARLRELSGGARGLDDFARAFFSAGGGMRTYTFEEVCRTLEALAHDDWTARLRRHLDSHEDGDALAGLARAGWGLRFDEVATETFRQDETDSGVSNLDHSVGAQVRADGTVRSVVWEGPAFAAGLAPGTRITGVNGRPFTAALLEQAVRQAGSSPLSLTFEGYGPAQTAVVDYHGSLRYPHLVRLAGTVDRLTPLLSPRRARP